MITKIKCLPIIGMISLFITCLPITTYGATMQIPTMADRAEEFKKSIQFQEKIAKKEKAEQVCVDWDKLAAPEAMAGWKVTDQIKEDLPSYTAYSWVFNRADDYVVVNVKVYPTAKNTAPSDFIDIANATSMQNIPYVAGPDELGTVSAISKSKLNKSVFWFFRNTLIRVSNKANDFDVLPLAHWLQKQAEVHLLPIKKE